MVLKNSEIYNLAIKTQIFYKDKTAQFPAKIGFCLFKNLKILRDLAIEIEQMRQQIIDSFQPEIQEDGSYKINSILKDKLQKELTDLSNITQEVNLFPLEIEDFENLELSVEQLDALVDMVNIKEKKEDNLI